MKLNGPDEEDGYYCRLDLDDGRSIWIYPRPFNTLMAIGLLADYPYTYDQGF